MSWIAPSVADFKAYFVRDFPYAPTGAGTNPDYILDSDITKAITEAGDKFNPSLGYGEDIAVTRAFMYLAAFFLVENIKMSSAGISGQIQNLVSSKSVGGISESYSIPEKFTKSPYTSIFLKNKYGERYLALSFPLIVGGVGLVDGTTTAG